MPHEGFGLAGTPHTALGHTGQQCRNFEAGGWAQANAQTKAGCLKTFGSQLGTPELLHTSLVAGAGCFLLPTPALRDACFALTAPPLGPSACTPPLFRNPVTGRCELDIIPGAGGGGIGAEGRGAGEALMGRYGAALAPFAESVTTLRCIPGMVLGTDDLCYNRRDITNKERKWPRGRAPLLTGGERNAITKANRAARKIERTTKQLQKMGMLKKPSTQRRRPQQRLIGPGPPGGTSIINVD